MSTLWIDYGYQDKLYWVMAAKFKGDNNLVIEVTESVIDSVTRLRKARLQWVEFDKVVFVQPFVVEDEAQMFKKWLVQSRMSRTLIRIKSQWQHEELMSKYFKAKYEGRLYPTKKG